MNRENDVIVGLDIGSSKIAVLVCEVGENKTLEAIGIGTSPSIGLRRGMITDIDSAAQSISDAILRAENMSGCSIGAATVSLAGANIQAANSKGVIAVTRQDREITKEDVERVLDAAKVIAIPPDREIIHVLPKEFVIDGCRGIRRPVGMSGIRLEVETHIVTGAATSIQNVRKSVSKAGIDIEQMLLQPLASAEAVLNQDEKEQGVVLIDMGSGTTNLAVFSEGSVVHTAVIPIGGSHITNDIAVVMRVPLPIAEELKIGEGVAISSLVQEGSICEFVPSDMGRLYRNLDKNQLAAVIQARLEEIFSHVAAELDKIDTDCNMPASIVLTGGTSGLNSISDLASDYLDLPVRIGTINGIYGMSSIVSSPEFSTVVGLCKVAYADSKYQDKPSGNSNQQKNKAAKGKKQAFGGIRDLFRDMFD